MKPIYEAVADAPGQIIPYGYGLARFWELRERTQSALGENFDMEDYHLQLLTNGPRSFDTVEEDLKRYVEGKGAELPEEYTFFESERSEGMTSMSGIFSFIEKHQAAIGIGILVVGLLILVLVFLLLRAIFRALFGRRKK